MSKQLLRYIGLVEETTYADPTILTPTIYLDPEGFEGINPAQDSDIAYEGGLSRNSRFIYPGRYMIDASFTTAADVTSLGYLLKWALTGYTEPLDNLTEPHVFAQTNELELQSFQIQAGKDDYQHNVLGATIDSLELSFTDKLLIVSVSANASKDDNGSVIKSQNTAEGGLSTNAPLVYSNVTRIEIGSTIGDVKDIVKDFSFTINNNYDEDSSHAGTSRFAKRGIYGNFSCELSMTLYPDASVLKSLQEIKYGSPGATGPSNLPGSEENISIRLEKSADEYIVIEIPQAYLTELVDDKSGREVGEVSLTFMSLEGTPSSVEFSDSTNYIPATTGLALAIKDTDTVSF